MATLNDLVKFIESQPSAGDYIAWEKALESAIPNFKSLVKDPNNWPTLEKIKPKEEEIYDKFFRDLEHNDRLELTKHFFYSSNERLREEAKSWLCSWNIESSSDWTGLDDNMKNHIIMPIASEVGHSIGIEHFFNIHRDLHHIEAELYHLRHVYGELNGLKKIIQQSKDFDYVAPINDRIDKIKQFFSTPIIKYIPDENELELINSLIDLFKANGFSSKKLPDIYLSFETPPLFIKYPELDDMSRYIDEFFDRKRKERDKKIAEDERRKPEFYDIEELLGVYIPNPKIILYARGLIWCAKTLSVDEKVLRTVVLIHEIGHWITHQLPPNKIEQWFKTQLLPNFKHKHKNISNISKWPTEHYNKTSTNVHEGWAQIMTWWIVNKVGGDLKDTFDKLNQRQSRPYHVYKDLTNEDINTLIKTLVMLRMLNKGATLVEWFTFLKLLSHEIL